MKKTVLTRFVCLTLLCIFSSFVQAKVSITEIMAYNVSTVMDTIKDGSGNVKGGTGNFPGWVEFYNDGEIPISLKGSIIEQRKKNGNLKWSWEIKEDSGFVIEPQKYLIIYFDKQGSSKAYKYGHSPYKIDPDGGSITLIMSGSDTYSLSYKKMYPYLSYGQKNDTLGYMIPTPRKANKTAYLDLETSRCAKPYFLGLQPGVYSSIDSVIRLRCATDSVKIYYTTDGSEPTESSTYYDGGFELGGSKGVRARAYKKGMLPSEILTGSFIARGKYQLPIVSILCDDKYLTSGSIGIYTTGSNGIKGEKSCLSDAANYNQDWTRTANMEYFKEGKQKFSQEADISIMGGCSRKEAVKSLKISTGKKYCADTFAYNPFKDDKNKKANKYVSFQLRNGGNAYEDKYLCFRDGFMQAVAKGMGNIDYQGYVPVGFYLNGKYKRLMGLRERTNKDFVYSNYGYDEDEIDVIEITERGVGATAGDRVMYDRMIQYARNNYKSSDYLEKMNDFMDMDEYLNYIIFEQFIVNTDWPGNNYKMWRHRSGGRFRCILFDTDFGLGLYKGDKTICSDEFNMIEWCDGTSSTADWGNRDPNDGSGFNFKTILFSSLMKNEEFKLMFVTKFMIHLNNTLNYRNFNTVGYEFASLVMPEYEKSFGHELDTTSENSAFRKMLQFAQARYDNIPSHLAAVLKDVSSDKVNLTLSCKTDDNKTLQVGYTLNNVNVVGPDYTFRGLKGMKVNIGANLPDGYVVKKWKVGDKEYATPTISLNLKSETSVTLYLKKDSDKTPKIFINEICSKNSIMKDDMGETPDWVELYNASDTLVDVAGYYITDDSKNLKLHQIAKGYSSTIIPSKGHLVLYADGGVKAGPLHIGFKLSDTKGETLTLSKIVNDSLVTVNSVSFTSVGENSSTGRVTDGASKFTTFHVCDDGYNTEATPGLANGSIDCDSIMKANTYEVTLEADWSYTHYFFNNEKVGHHSYYTTRIRKGDTITLEPDIDDKNFVSWKCSEIVPYTYDLLTSQTEWSYFYDSIAPSQNWMKNDFEEGKSWKKGKGKMGYNTRYDTVSYDTKLNYGSNGSKKYLTAYFRASFNFNSKQADSIVLSLIYDDAAVVYLNGKMLGSFNMDSDSVITYSSKPAKYIDDSTATIVLQPSDLKATNVLAVEIHQIDGESSDLTFKLNMKQAGETDMFYDKVVTFVPTRDVSFYLTTQDKVDVKNAEKSEDPVIVYPNPTSDFVHIQSVDNISFVSVCDMLGRCLKKIMPQTNSCQLDVKNLKEGSYILQVASESKVLKQILIVK